MGEVVNLRMARKRAARAADAEAAEASRARHGMTGAERRRLAAEESRAEAHLDGHRLSPNPAAPDPPAEPKDR